MLAILVNLADWLAVDAWLSGGKVVQPGEPQPDESSNPSFRANSMVLCMAAELPEPAVTMAATRRYYSVVDVASDARLDHRLGDRGLAKTVLARGAERAGTGICSGEGGILPTGVGRGRRARQVAVRKHLPAVDH